jgi:oligosaccharide repeat unit polymerase
MVPINLFLVFPVTYAISPICAVEYVTGNPHKYRYLLINILVALLSMLHHGGRYTIVFFALCYLFSFLVFGRRTRLSRQAKRLILGVFTGLVLVFMFVSLSRGIDDLIESVYSYLGCSVPHMISRLASAETGTVASTHGFLALNGFISPFMILFKGIGMLHTEPIAYQSAQSILAQIEEVAWIGSNVSTNAFLPPAFFFYIDGGMIGVLVGMLVYGFVSSLAFGTVKTSRNKRSSAMYLLIVYGLVLSFARLYFCSSGYALAIPYIAFMYRERSAAILRDAPLA